MVPCNANVSRASIWKLTLLKAKPKDHETGIIKYETFCRFAQSKIIQVPGNRDKVQLLHTPKLTCHSTVSHVYAAASLPLLLQEIQAPKIYISASWRNVVLPSPLRRYGRFIVVLYTYIQICRGF